jgi:hypothetical protein
MLRRDTFTGSDACMEPTPAQAAARKKPAEIDAIN